MIARPHQPTRGNREVSQPLRGGPRRLLVYVNSNSGHQPVIQQAAAVARRTGGQIRIVASVPEVPWHALRLGLSERDARASMDGRTRDRLAALAAPHRRSGLEIEIGLLQGTPFLSVIKEAEDGRHDVILKQAEEATGEGPGTTALHLARKSPRPVWIVRPEEASGPRRVLAAVDVDPSAPERERLASRVLRFAARLAEATASELHTVYAYEPFPPGPQTRDDAGYRAALAVLVGRRVEQALRRARVAGQTHVVLGEPATAILAEAKRLGAHTLVLASVGRVAPGFLIGGTAEPVLMRAPCSTLTLKPAGFVTPILALRHGME